MDGEDRPASPRTEAGTLRVRRIVFEDGASRSAAVLGEVADGHGLVLVGPDERPRAQLVLDEAGAAHVKLHDRGGEVCLWLRVAPTGTPSLWLRGVGDDRRVRGHAELQVDAYGAPSLSLHDRHGRPRALLRVDERDGRPSLALADPRGDACVLLRDDTTERRAAAAPARARPAGTVVPRPVGAAVSEPCPAAPGRTVSFGPYAADDGSTALEASATPEPLVLAAPEPPAEPDGAPGWDATLAPDAIADPVAVSAPDAEPGADAEPGPDAEPGRHAAADAPSDPRIAALTARVARLERRRWRRPRLATAALILLAVGFGAFAGRLLDASALLAVDGIAPLAARESGVRVVEAQEVVLRAPSGEVRGRLGLLDAGGAFLQLLGPDGRSEVELSALSGRQAQLRLAGGDATALVDAGPDGTPSLGLWKDGEAVFQAPQYVARFPPPRDWE